MPTLLPGASFFLEERSPVRKMITAGLPVASHQIIIPALPFRQT